MAQWLVKEEPEHYPYDQLVKDGKTVWAGVRNPLAQKHLRSIKKGDRIFYYHTGKEKAIVAVARSCRRHKRQSLESSPWRMLPAAPIRIRRTPPARRSWWI